MTKTTDDPFFDDIRPCRDEEVAAEILKIIADREVTDGILKFRFGKIARYLPFIFRPLVKKRLHQTIGKVKTIAAFQELVASYMRHMIATTTDGVTYSGFDKLNPNHGCIFISNHRDISLDPAFVDMALYEAGRDTVRIAIGDNLLSMPAATSLMRLNKSFIVKRSVSSPREKLKELAKLSEYIGLSIKEGYSIWIAQREGRAKDGDDRTDPAILKMLYMYGRQQQETFVDYMRKLNIVPVAISYEYDPGDLAKAGELYEKSVKGLYQKKEFEDIESIVEGIRGYKGRVEIAAGSPLQDGFETPEELASLIDHFIWTHYRLFPPCLIAAGRDDKVSDEDRQKFAKRLEQYPQSLRELVISMYSMPFRNLMKLNEAGQR